MSEKEIDSFVQELQSRLKDYLDNRIEIQPDFEIDAFFPNSTIKKVEDTAYYISRFVLNCVGGCGTFIWNPWINTEHIKSEFIDRFWIDSINDNICNGKTAEENFVDLLRLVVPNHIDCVDDICELKVRRCIYNALREGKFKIS